MAKVRKTLPAAFYETATGKEPVREWLKRLSSDDRKVVGEDIATLEFSWPVGMPNQMVLLHGFVKTTQKTPDKEIELAVKRMKEVHNDA